jgi:antitoxin component YwqK of YwqJK toxin-antitoxin module/tetratricopeptide (TPR) repeat protein
LCNTFWQKSGLLSKAINLCITFAQKITMKQLSLLFAFLPLFLMGQKNIESVSSVEIIAEGSALYENKSYYDAIAKFKQVSINDTLYSEAQYNLAKSYISSEEFFFARKVLNELLAFQIPIRDKDLVYVLLGATYEGEEKYEDAIRTYDEGLQLFPKNHHLYYARGITHNSWKKTDLALEDFKNAVRCNAWNANSHLQLGIIAAREGKFTEATLSLMTYLMNDPFSDKAPQVLAMLENLADGSYTPEPENIQLSAAGDDFSTLNEFFRNKVALQDKYKAKFTLQTSFGRQMHLILSSVKYDVNDPGFWHQQYLPFYQDIFESKLLDGLILYALQGSESSLIQQKLQSKKAKINAFLTAASPKWRQHSSHQYMELDGEMQHVTVVYNTSGTQAAGLEDATGEPLGEWRYYHEDGGLNLSGVYTNGERSGEWLWRDSFTHKVTEKSTYENGILNGKSYFYFPSGELDQTRIFKDGILQDSVISFYRSGDVEQKTAVKDDQRQGQVISFYANGQKSFETTYVNGKVDGDVIYYHKNGMLNNRFKVSNELITGQRLTYFPNGKPASDFTYTATGQTGPYKRWYANGQLESEGTMKADKQIGESVSYYSNGQKKSTSTFDESGKENGTTVYYDYDGKKYEEHVFKKGYIEEIRYFDKKGTQLSTHKKSGKKFNYLTHYPNGNNELEGLFSDDYKTGKWIHYDQYGNVEATEMYTNGVLSDTAFEYFPNGQIKSVTPYKNGERDGIYLKYNLLNVLVEEGRYKAGQRSNDWYRYYDNGNLENESSFKDGTLNGLLRSYTSKGKLYNYDLYEDGDIIATVYLDTNEQIIQSFGQLHGEVKLRDPLNHYDRFTGNYKSGDADGIFSWRDPSGKLNSTGQYVDDLRDGLWTYYYPDGKISRTIMYTLGEMHGVTQRFSESGTLVYEGTYVSGELQGIAKFYYDNGQPEMEANYVDDERNGRCVYYSIQGPIQQVRYYERGVILSYSYMDASGKEVEPIQLTKGVSQIRTFFPNGSKAIVQTRENGSINGVHQEFHPNGKLAEEINYLCDQRHGKSTVYDEKGGKISETDYLLDGKNGLEVYYYPNGTVKSTQEFVLDERFGAKKEYNPAGKLVKTTHYYNNETIEVINH